MIHTLHTIQKNFFNRLQDQYSVEETQTLFYIFMEEIFGLSKAETHLQKNREVSQEMIVKCRNIMDDLLLGKPYQYILGKSAFFGTHFLVDNNVLIPRPETEELLELAIDTIKKSPLKEKSIRILDIGTGSGIIPVILKKHFPETEIFAVDISEKAIEVAKSNAKLHDVAIDFINLDFLTFNTNICNENWDILISNPPYISENEKVEMSKSVTDFEPKLALFPDHEDPLIFYHKIHDFAKKFLADNGFIFLEINQYLAAETLAIFADFGVKSLQKDLSGNFRFVVAQK